MIFTAFQQFFFFENWTNIDQIKDKKLLLMVLYDLVAITIAQLKQRVAKNFPQPAVREMFEPNISKLTMVIQVIEERLQLGHKNKFRCLLTLLGQENTCMVKFFIQSLTD